MRTLMLPMLLLLAACWVLPASGSIDGRKAAAGLLANASISGILSGIRDGRFTCEDLISEQLRRIDAYNASLAAFISVDKEAAMAAAKAKDSQGGLSGALHCVPVAVKDNADVKGVPTTSGAPALRTMTAASDSAVVARIRAAGGIVIGKANMAEMSDSGTSSVSTLGGVCANPWDKRRSCLGSSGGSGAAVAAGLAVLGVGTDTEGSVIGPCTASGLVCIRPTQNAQFEAMREGVYPAFQRQDLVGLMARSRGDYLTAHDAVYGSNFSQTISGVTQLNKMTIRFLDNFYESFPISTTESYSPDPEMVRLHNRAAERLAGLGATIQRYRTNGTDLGAKLGVIFQATSTKPRCSNSCMKKSLNDYLRRYSATGPFRNASDLQRVISGFPISYQEKLNFTISQPDDEVCGAAACDPYNIGRSNVTDIMRELLGDADVLAVPFTAKLPQLNSVQPGLADQISPALNPYTGWPSLAL
uniref:Amidase domain-containing protein n=1 Tax=Macrostomum lignano TaxID=282301 RepID=A0A1I8H380_9PLAT